MSIIVADRRGNTDGSMFRLFEHFDSRVPIVLMSKTHNYKFNEALLSLDKYVLVDVSEYGWDWSLPKSGTHIWGKNTSEFPQFADNEHYQRFDDFVAQKPPLLTFKRELLKRDVTETMIPIDYPCWFQVPPTDSKEKYLGREITGMFFWGRSHEARLQLHAEIWRQASTRGYSVCDNLYYFEKFFMEEKGEKWVSLWIPHYGRVDITNILSINELSLTSIALPGAGVKTFRHVESSFNSSMVKYKDELAWAYPWVGGENCIECEEGKEVAAVYDAIENENQLYEIYRNGVENCSRYEVRRYVAEYILPKINQL